MRLKQQYQELMRLKKEINQKLQMGTDFQRIRELMLYLAQESAYGKLKSKENQLIMIERFFNIWLMEKRRLPDLGIETDIFSNVSSLEDVEYKYQRVKYCGLRIENAVPEEFCDQAIQWLEEDKISGFAVGKIVVFETKNREDNILKIARRLRKKGDILNALLLLEYANGNFQGQENLLLEEADIWAGGQQWERAKELLKKIENPSQYTKELMMELRQVAVNG